MAADRGHHVLRVPSSFDAPDSSHSSSRAYSSTVYRKKNVLPLCTLPLTFVARPLFARTSRASLRCIRIFCSSAHILLYLFTVHSAMTQGRQRKHWLRSFTPSASYKVSADRKDRKHYCTRVHYCGKKKKRYTTHRRHRGVMHGSFSWKTHSLSKIFSSFFEANGNSCSCRTMGALTSTSGGHSEGRAQTDDMSYFYSHRSWVIVIINVEIFKIPIITDVQRKHLCVTLLWVFTTSA